MWKTKIHMHPCLLYNTFLMILIYDVQPYHIGLIVHQFYPSFLHFPSALWVTSSNKPLKFYKEKLYGFCAGLYDSSVRYYARYSGAFSPTLFSVDNSALKTPEVVERLVFGCMWGYHICQHTFLKTTTSSSSLMFCLTSFQVRSIS